MNNQIYICYQQAIVLNGEGIAICNYLVKEPWVHFIPSVKGDNLDKLCEQEFLLVCRNFLTEPFTVSWIQLGSISDRSRFEKMFTLV